MGDVIATIFGVVAVVFVMTYFVFTSARARNDRHREERLSIAFDRAKAVRTQGIGTQGSPYGHYTEPVRTNRRSK